MCARIAYVDHSYHRRTRSTLFLPDALIRRGHRVDIFWDEKWIGGESVLWETVADHDVVIMFQSYCPTDDRTFRSLHPNVVYVPMHDQFGFPSNSATNLSAFWEPFQGSKVLSFSASVHMLATGFGIVTHQAQYHPEVPPAPERPPDGLHGFFWLRRQAELGWNMVRALVGSTRFDSFHVHVVGDPGFPDPQAPPPEDVDAYRITVSAWFDRRSELDDILRRVNVYFAPRLAEGIGQSFLEAMSRGQCVVAPDGPTMNEYIVHGVNGLLYDPRVPAPLDFSEVAHLGQEARRGMTAGRRRWEEAEELLVDFILTPSSTFYDRAVQASAEPVATTGDGERGSTISRAIRSVSRVVRPVARSSSR
jgi:hypothetical protein